MFWIGAVALEKAAKNKCSIATRYLFRASFINFAADTKWFKEIGKKEKMPEQMQRYASHASMAFEWQENVGKMGTWSACENFRLEAKAKAADYC